MQKIVNEYINSSITAIVNILLSQKESKVIRYPIDSNKYETILRGGTERPEDFLFRILGDASYGKKIYDDYIISENLLMFIELEQDDNKEFIKKLSIQAFVTEDVEMLDYAYYDKIPSKGKVYYYRLDYELGNLGSIFKEPLPHVHIVPKGNPRFSVDDLKNDIIVNFFDLLYRNHFYDEWIEWVQRYISNENREVFDALQKYYKKNDYSVIFNDYSYCLKSIKDDICNIKRQWYNWIIDLEIASTLSFK